MTPETTIVGDIHQPDEYWIAYADIDGFRLDAAKHVTDDFLAYFSTHIREYAKTIGKENFMVMEKLQHRPIGKGEPWVKNDVRPTGPGSTWETCLVH